MGGAKTDVDVTAPIEGSDPIRRKGIVRPRRVSGSRAPSRVPSPPSNQIRVDGGLRRDWLARHKRTVSAGDRHSADLDHEIHVFAAALINADKKKRGRVAWFGGSLHECGRFRRCHEPDLDQKRRGRQNHASAPVSVHTHRERTPMWGIERPRPQASELPHVPREILREQGPAILDTNKQYDIEVPASTAWIELSQEVLAPSSTSTPLRFQCAH
jgi:hypothetical protein